MLQNKIHPLLFLGIVNAMSLFSSCNNNDSSEEEKEDPVVTFSDECLEYIKNGISFSSESESKTISFTTNKDWSVSSENKDLCTVSPDNGKAGKGSFIINTTTNNTREERSTTVILTVGNLKTPIKIIQSAKGTIKKILVSITEKDTEDNNYYNDTEFEYNNNNQITAIKNKYLWSSNIHNGYDSFFTIAYDNAPTFTMNGSTYSDVKFNKMNYIESCKWLEKESSYQETITATFTYDEEGRLLSSNYFNSEWESNTLRSFKYDEKGNLTECHWDDDTEYYIIISSDKKNINGYLNPELEEDAEFPSDIMEITFLYRAGFLGKPLQNIVQRIDRKDFEEEVRVSSGPFKYTFDEDNYVTQCIDEINPNISVNYTYKTIK